MAEKTFKIEVVTPDRVVLTDEAVSLVAPGIEGYLGVLPNHAPLVTALGVGELRYRSAAGQDVRLAVSGGFMEVTGSKTVVLADAAERPEEINTERSRNALELGLHQRRELAEKFDEARAAEVDAGVERARNRLKIAGGSAQHPH